MTYDKAPHILMNGRHTVWDTASYMRLALAVKYSELLLQKLALPLATNWETTP
jgi:hypothetical protein